MQRKALYFVNPDDLREGFRRVGIKRDELIERASPFYVDLGQPGYRLELSDLIERYSTVGKKDITDEYNISPEKKVLVMGVKPTFSSDDINRSREFIARVRDLANRFHLHERGIELHYGGNYTIYVEAYDSVRDSLAPTTGLALAGVAIVLFIFIRRVMVILALMASLLFSIALTAGVTGIVVGELNLLTSMFAGILAGFGIDFGIHLTYRIREELAAGLGFVEAVTEAIWHSGAAAAFSAATTTGAFITLVPSSFGGFSQFGLISAYGLVLTWLCMFFVTPVLYALLYKWNPELLGAASARKELQENETRWKHRLSGPLVARVLLLGLMALFVVAALFAGRLRFDGSARNMVDQTTPSERLTDELALRFEVAGSPSVIAVESLDEARAVWEYFEPMTEAQRQSIAQVISPFTFVPPRWQQLENHRMMQQFLRDSAAIPQAAVPEQYRGLLNLARSMMSERPYSIDDVPLAALENFRQAPGVDQQIWLTIIYPIVDQLGDASGVQAFGRLLEEVRYPIVGRLSIQDMAYQTTAYERRRGRAIPGDLVRQPIAGIEGLSLSEREINGVLAIANEADENFLRREVGLSALAAQTILAGRPFADLNTLQSKRLLARAAGANSVLARFITTVQGELRYILLGSLLMTIALLAVSVRRISLTLISLAPLAGGILLTVGALGLLDIPLNYFNIAVVPILFGYGVNSGIFMLHRYLECGDVFKSISRTGAAALGSTLTSMAGWGAIASTDHPGLRSMGVLAVVGLAAMMIATLVFLPALLRLLEPIIPTLRRLAHEARNASKNSTEAVNAR